MKKCSEHFSRRSGTARKHKKWVAVASNSNPTHCRWFQKQFSELFSLAVEDEMTVSRRSTSNRGGRKPPTKKESNSNSTSNKKSSEANNKYSSEESSDVSWTSSKIIFWCLKFRFHRRRNAKVLNRYQRNDAKRPRRSPAIPSDRLRIVQTFKHFTIIILATKASSTIILVNRRLMLTLLRGTADHVLGLKPLRNL